MIVRNVLDDQTVLDNFDYYNDSKDTISWLEWVCMSSNATEDRRRVAKSCLRRLRADAQKYWEAWRERAIRSFNAA